MQEQRRRMQELLCPIIIEQRRLLQALLCDFNASRARVRAADYAHVLHLTRRRWFKCSCLSVIGVQTARSTD